MKRSKAREFSFLLLFQFEFHDASEYLELFDFFWNDITEYTESDRKYVWNKVNNVLLNLEKIDSYLNQYAHDWNIERMSNTDRAILRLAAYEILFDDEIPGKVAINEAVELAKSFGEDTSYSFINGILRTVYKLSESNKLP